jgi:hypothetical protein
MCEQHKLSEAIGPYSVEERMLPGEVVWVAIRARGAEWSWLTPAEAAQLGRRWVERYGCRQAHTPTESNGNHEPCEPKPVFSV